MMNLFRFKIITIRISMISYLLLGFFSYCLRSINGLSDIDMTIITSLIIPNFLVVVVNGLKYLKDARDTGETVNSELARYGKILIVLFGFSPLVVIFLMSFNVVEFSDREFSYGVLLAIVSSSQILLQTILADILKLKS